MRVYRVDAKAIHLYGQRILGLAVGTLGEDFLGRGLNRLGKGQQRQFPGTLVFWR